MNDNVKIKLENLSASYDKINVLKNINFDIKDKDFIALVGRNGSGKTSIINAIFGLCKINSGKIFYNFEKVYDSVNSIFDDISVVPQKVNFLYNFCINDFIEFGLLNFLNKLKIKKSDKKQKELKEIMDYKEKIFQILDVNKLLNKKVNEISSGQLKRVLIAQSLVKKPKILFLDECLANLDLKFQFEVLRLLKEINLGGTIIVMILSNLNLVYNFFEKIIFIKNGEIVDVFEKINRLEEVSAFRQEKAIFFKIIQQTFELNEKDFGSFF
ncbi:MAG: ATP-binding cassette domain-containing protein [Elusimicrobiota bacterium]|jgi:ABC-type cobalamin/Fe3+-siderophores transport system ATPase subunit|nr:ATP-binding cassette domain-containing protein [Elusimicrobiota bacterium]